MGRFDQFINKNHESIIKNDENIKKNLDVWMYLKNDSIFIKYSLILGDILFKFPIIKNISIQISRAIFRKTKGYKLNDLNFEENFSKSYLGIFYFFLLLILLLKFNFYLILISCIIVYFNINTLNKFVLEDIKKSIDINSDEILEFLSWLILLLETGMSINLSFEYYLKFSNGNLKNIIESEINMVNAGKKSLDMALSELSINIQKQDLKEIFTLILQSKKLGVSIKDSLSEYFERYQDRLFTTAEKKGASANQKASFILTAEVFLLMIIFMIALISTLLTGGIF
ncbi:MAG: type II secretion system F family protein [Caldisericia bacterium]